MSYQLELNNVSIRYGDFVASHQISLGLKNGEIGCLLGPSGCGKTTLLRAIAGFESVSAGEIYLHGHCVSEVGKSVSPEQRQVGMVFQDFALFPHLTIEQNVAFGLRHMAKKEKNIRVNDLLQLANLEQHKDHYSHQLSGGQQQRVALIRAMAPRPQILLLDEPFSSLDVELREQLAKEVRALIKAEGMTAILVTHDQLEAFAMTDSIGVINQGCLQQWDNGYGLYHNPANRFVAEFIGQGTLLRGLVTSDKHLDTSLGILPGLVPDGCKAGQKLDVLLRPDDVMLNKQGGALQVMIVDKAFRGSEYLYTLRLSDGTTILALTPSHANYEKNSSVGITLDVQHLVVFPIR